MTTTKPMSNDTLAGFAGFGRAVMDWLVSIPEWWGDETIDRDILPLAEQHGLAQRVPYDPATHGDEIDAGEGDPIWFVDKNTWPTLPPAQGDKNA